MKKTILALSFILMGAIAGSASAQTSDKTSCENPENCKKEKCEKADCDKTNCPNADSKGFDCKMPPRGKDIRRGNMPGQCAQQCPFEGLNLSEEQKVKVQDLEKAMEASKKELKEKVKEDSKGEGKEGKRAEMMAAAKDLRVKYLEDLKNILSPEQYTQFLQNFYINQGSQPNPFKAGMQKMDRKIQGEKRMGAKEFDKDKKIVSTEAKKIEKSVEKDVKKMEKKVEKKVKK